LGGTTLPGEAWARENISGFAALAPATPTKLPIEARDGGIYQGFLLTWLYLIAIRRARAKGMPPVWMLITMLIFIAAMAADGFNALFYDLQFLVGMDRLPYLYAPRLELRMLTGLLTGVAFAGILLPIANYYLWRANDTRPIIADGKQFAGALAVIALFGIAVHSEIGIFYYPAAIISAASVVVLLTLINAVFILSWRGRAAYAANWRAALDPLALGTAATIVELGTLSLARYAILGTATLP